MPDQPAPAAWWLHGGTEERPHCGQRYRRKGKARQAAAPTDAIPSAQEREAP